MYWSGIGCIFQWWYESFLGEIILNHLRFVSAHLKSQPAFLSLTPGTWATFPNLTVSAPLFGKIKFLYQAHRVYWGEKKQQMGRLGGVYSNVLSRDGCKKVAWSEIHKHNQAEDFKAKDMQRRKSNSMVLYNKHNGISERINSTRMSECSTVTETRSKAWSSFLTSYQLQNVWDRLATHKKNIDFNFMENHWLKASFN